MKGVCQTIKNEAKIQKGGFHGMLIDTLLYLYESIDR